MKHIRIPTWRRYILSVFFILFLAAFIPKAAVSADTKVPDATVNSVSGNAVPSPSVTPVPVKKKRGKWVRKKGWFYYYNEEGKMLKNGIFTIGKKKYCFDKKGRQLTGWRKIRKHTYYFRYSNGKNGYMVTNRKIDGVRLKKNGRAAPKGSRAKRKLPILVRVQKLTDKVIRPSMKQSEKLKACFEYVRDHYSMHTIPELGHSSGDWDLNYAEFMLSHGYGDCYCYAAAFAYFANAVGVKGVLTANDDGHGWTESDGKYYDAHWAKVIGTDKCYASPASLSGTGGRPNWAAYGCFYRNYDK